MKTFIVLTIFAIIISCIKGSYTILDIQSDNVYVEIVRRYCDLSVESRKSFRSCLNENGIWTGSELYRNCAQQLKFAHTFEDLDKFVCQPGTKLESLFFKCFIAAYSTFNRDNPKTIPVVEKCLSYEEGDGFQTKYRIKGVYHV